MRFLEAVYFSLIPRKVLNCSVPSQRSSTKCTMRMARRCFAVFAFAVLCGLGLAFLPGGALLENRAQ
jgi:hypothetical protein